MVFANSAAAPIPRPAEGPGGPVGGLSRECTAPHEAGGFEEQDQNEQGQGDHEYGNLRIGLAGQVGGPCGRDAGNKRQRDRSRSHYADQGGQTDFSSGGRGYVHGIDVFSSLQRTKKSMAMRCQCEAQRVI